MKNIHKSEAQHQFLVNISGTCKIPFHLIFFYFLTVIILIPRRRQLLSPSPLAGRWGEPTNCDLAALGMRRKKGLLSLGPRTRPQRAAAGGAPCARAHPFAFLEIQGIGLWIYQSSSLLASGFTKLIPQSISLTFSRVPGSGPPFGSLWRMLPLQDVPTSSYQFPQGAHRLC